jgi:hypothetical protein
MAKGSTPAIKLLKEYHDQDLFYAGVVEAIFREC